LLYDDTILLLMMFICRNHQRH